MHDRAENGGTSPAASSARALTDKPDPFTPPPGKLDHFEHGIGTDRRPTAAEARVAAAAALPLAAQAGPMKEHAREHIGDDFARAINRRSDEILSHTPDFISGDFLESAFHAFNHAINRREDWYRDTRMMEQKREHAEHAGEIKAIVHYLELVMARVYRLALVAGSRHTLKTVDQDFQITRLLYDLLEWVETSIPPVSLADVKRRVAESVPLPFALDQMAGSIDRLSRGEKISYEALEGTLSRCATLLRRAAETVRAANVHAVNECEASHNAKANQNGYPADGSGAGVGNILGRQR